MAERWVYDRQKYFLSPVNILIVRLLTSSIFVLCLCSCGDREASRMKAKTLCRLELRNESGLMIEEVKVDVGDGQFSPGIIGVSASRVLVGFRMPKNATSIHLAWSVDSGVFITNSLALPEKWNTVPHPEITITILNHSSSVKLGR